MVDVNTVVENLDIDGSTKEHLLSQFQGKVNIESLLTIFAAELQELESAAIIPLLDKRTLIEAVGDQLDNIGETLGIQRRGLIDDYYRSILLLRLFQRNNRGTYQNIIDILGFSFGDSEVILQKGAGYDLDIAVTFCEILGNDADYIKSLLVEGLLEALPAVTSVRIVEKPQEVFGFVGNPYAVGYGAIGQTGGGGMSTEIFNNRT